MCGYLCVFRFQISQRNLYWGQPGTSYWPSAVQTADQVYTVHKYNVVHLGLSNNSGTLGNMRVPDSGPMLCNRVVIFFLKENWKGHFLLFKCHSSLSYFLYLCLTVFLGPIWYHWLQFSHQEAKDNYRRLEFFNRVMFVSWGEILPLNITLGFLFYASGRGQMLEGWLNSGW